MDHSRRTYSTLLAFSALWCAFIAAAPLLRAQHLPGSEALYGLFSAVCHQFPDRSFFLAGEPLGVCIRCSSIYGSFFVALALYPLLRTVHGNRIPPAWILFSAMTPLVVDVLLSVTGLHLSSTWTRVLTGFGAGTILPFYLIPPFREAVNQLAVLRGDSAHAAKT